MFGLGLPELALLLFIALMLFGPSWFVKAGRSLGQSVSGFADAFKEGKTGEGDAHPALKAPEEQKS